MRAAGDAFVAGVERELPGWAQRQVDRVLDAWSATGRADEEEVARARAAAVDAGRRAARRVAHELRALLDLDPAQQTTTPLEIVRGAVAEPTEVLAGAAIPPVERDAFDERAWPDDVYGLVPRSPADLEHEITESARTETESGAGLGPLLLAWGMAKAAVLRARAART